MPRKPREPEPPPQRYLNDGTPLTRHAVTDDTGKVIGYSLEVPPDDPRNPNHPSHDEQWLELARALGRALADRGFDRMQEERRKPVWVASPKGSEGGP
jgi:hypothetical protein